MSIPASMRAHQLITADRWIDHNLPVASFGSNAANVFLKVGILIERLRCSQETFAAKRQSSPDKDYWEYLENKSFSFCVMAMIPAFGQIFRQLKTISPTEWDSLCYSMDMVMVGEKQLDNLQHVSVGVLHERIFLKEVFAYYQKKKDGVEAIINHKRYQQLPKEYREEIEQEYGEDVEKKTTGEVDQSKLSIILNRVSREKRPVVSCRRRRSNRQPHLIV